MKGEEVRGWWLRGQICWLTPTVSDTIQQVAMMAEALEASWRVDTYVVTGSIKGTLIYILAIPLIDEKLIALLAAAFKAAHCVAANVVTTPIVQAALIYVWESRTKRKSKVILKAEDK